MWVSLGAYWGMGGLKLGGEPHCGRGVAGLEPAVHREFALATARPTSWGGDEVPKAPLSPYKILQQLDFGPSCSASLKQSLT